MSEVMFDKILGRLREGGDGGGGGGGGDTPKTITVHNINNLLGELTDAQMDDLHVGDIIYDDEIDTFRVGTWWFVVSKDYYDYQYYLYLVRLGITMPNDYNTVKESWLYFDMREYIRLVTPVEGRYWKDAGMERKDFALTHSWNKAMDALVRYDWVENASFWKNGDFVQATDGLYLIVGSKGDPTRRFVKVDAESVTEVIYKYAHSTVYYDYYETRTTYLRTSVYTLQPQDGMIPNVLYNLGELAANTTFVLAAATDNTIANVWTWTFATGSTAPTITWPQQITAWADGEAPTIEANKRYEVSVMDGLACVVSADNIPQQQSND